MHNTLQIAAPAPRARHSHGAPRRAEVVGVICGLWVLLIWVLLTAACLAADPAKPAAKRTAIVTVDPSPVRITFPKEAAVGRVTVSNLSAPLSQYHMRAEALTSDSNSASVSFPANDSQDFLELQSPAAACNLKEPCALQFEVGGVRSEGNYKGSIDLYSAGNKTASVEISVIRTDPKFQPDLSGDVVKDGHIEFDATDADSFVLKVLNPVGSPWRKFRLQDPTALPVMQLVYSPSTFLLGPGQTLPVIGHIPGALQRNPAPHILKILDDEHTELQTSVVVQLKKSLSLRTRTWIVLLFVVFGACISVFLNNVVPLTWSKGELQASLRSAQRIVANCTLIGPALQGALTSELGRLHQVVRGIYFLRFDKSAVLQQATQDVVTVTALCNTAKAINAFRATTQSTPITIRGRLAIESRIASAEDALIAFDAVTATSRLNDAIQARTTFDADPKSADTLARDIQNLLSERGPTVPGRPADIVNLLSGLQHIQPLLTQLDQQKLFEVDRSFYIAAAWTGIVEPVLIEDPQRFQKFASVLLQCLLRNPTAQHVQLLLELMRARLTTEDIRSALERSAGYIECSDRPRYLELFDCSFVFDDPCLQSVEAARRLVSYRWDFDDNSEPPENFDRCKHYFSPQLIASMRRWTVRGNDERTITVTVAAHGSPNSARAFKRVVRVRGRQSHEWDLGVLQVFNFIFSSGIAVLTAFAAQYATSIPDPSSWQVCVTAFLFGFGIDQIRDKTTSPSASTAGAAAGAGSSSNDPRKSAAAK